MYVMSAKNISERTYKYRMLQFRTENGYFNRIIWM